MQTQHCKVREPTDTVALAKYSYMMLEGVGHISSCFGADSFRFSISASEEEDD